MKFLSRRYPVHGVVLLMVLLAPSMLLPGRGQMPFGAPITPQAQRSALGAVRSQVAWVQSATRVASNVGPQGFGNVWQAFEGLRQAYGAFKGTLTPNQLAYGANELAELDAGLDIIQEAFANYQQDLAAGQAFGPTMHNLCRVVREGSALWLQELNKTGARLHVGWGG